MFPVTFMLCTHLFLHILTCNHTLQARSVCHRLASFQYSAGVDICYFTFQRDCDCQDHIVCGTYTVTVTAFNYAYLPEYDFYYFLTNSFDCETPKKCRTNFCVIINSV